jgi:hypothetical protein
LWAAGDCRFGELSSGKMKTISATFDAAPAPLLQLLIRILNGVASAPSPRGEGWGEGNFVSLKITLIPTLLPQEKGFQNQIGGIRKT